MRKRKQIHPVKSDRYISLMITSNTANAGRFVRLHKLIFPLFAFLLVGIGVVIGIVYVRFETLNGWLADANNEKLALEAEKANTELLLSEKETIISDLLVSIEEKESQLNELELQAQRIMEQLESIEAIKDSLYEKLNEAPEDLFTSSTAGIVPYMVNVSMASYDAEDSKQNSQTGTSDSFASQYENILAKFSAITSSIEETHSDLNKLSDMTDLYLPYVNAIPCGYPILDSHITCEYGERIDPVTGKKNAFHYGIDFAAKYKQDIFATAPGTVIFSGYSTDFGYNIIIDHGYGYSTRYAHLSKLYVKKGDIVERGDLIGGAGSTGKSTAVHLHYEVRINDTRVDPIDYLH